MVISTPSFSYCKWNRYCQNRSSILPNFLLFAWFDTLEFSRWQCSNNKMCDDAVFALRFHYQLTMFRIRVFIGLSQLLHANIAYVIDSSKIFAAFLMNFLLFGWFDTVEFNRLPCSNNKMYDDVVFDDRFRYQLTYVWSVYIGMVISTSSYWCCIWNSYIKNRHLLLAWCGKRSIMQDYSETIV